MSKDEKETEVFALEDVMDDIDAVMPDNPPPPSLPDGTYNCKLAKIEVTERDNYDQEKQPGTHKALRFFFQHKSGCNISTFWLKATQSKKGALVKFLKVLDPKVVSAENLRNENRAKFIEEINALKGQFFLVTTEQNPSGEVIYNNFVSAVKSKEGADEPGPASGEALSFDDDDIPF